MNLKRKKMQDRADASKRLCAWIDRSNENVDSMSWRPVQVHRLGVAKLLHKWDMQFAVTTGKRGLIFFYRDRADPVWKHINWRWWPALGVGMDMDAKNCSALHHSEYHFELNISGVCDWAHGSNRDESGSLSEIGLGDFWKCFMVGLNVPFGRPQDEQSRMLQMEAAMRELFKKWDHRMPLFQSKVARMATALRLRGIQFNPDIEVDRQVWKHLEARTHLAHGRHRVTLNRFQGGITRAEEVISDWVFDEFESEYLGLEMDFLRGRKFAERIRLKASSADAVPEGGATTHPSAISIEDRSLRACCANGIAIRVCIWSNLTNERIVRIIVEGFSRLKHWDFKHRQLQRDVNGVLEFAKSEVGGGHMKLMNEQMHCLTDAASLERAGFLIDKTQMRAMESAEVASEDAFAEIFGNLQTTLTMRRIRRLLYFNEGWPHKMVDALNGDAKFTSTTALFKADVDDFLKLKDMKRSQPLDAIFKRHVMHKVMNEQYIAALEELKVNPGAKDDFCSIVGDHAKTRVPTIIAEETIGSMKNTKPAHNYGRKFRTPQFDMACALKSDVIAKRHKYENVDMARPMPHRCDAIPAGYFNPRKFEPSMNWKDVVSTKPQSACWSPPAALFGTPAADLPFLRQSRGDWNGVASNLWQGAFCKNLYNIVFNIKDAAPGAVTTYHYAMFHFASSCVVTWPGKWTKVPGAYAAEYFEFDKLAAHSIVPFANMDITLANTFKWRSYWWQDVNFPKAELAPGIRPFKARKKDEKFKVVMARNAFFTMGRVDIEGFAALWKIGLDGCVTLLSVLFRVSKSILQLSDGAVLEIIALRLGEKDLEASYLPTLLEIDEAINLFDIHDVKEIERAQAQGVESLENIQTFETEFQQMRRRVSDAAKEKIMLPKKLVLTADVTSHETASKFAPPDCSVWRGLTRAEWCGHCPPRKRVQKSWTEYTEKGALREVLRILWKQWLALHGLEVKDCTVQGLF